MLHIRENGGLGPTLQDYREAEDLAQAELADRIGVSQMSVSRYERGTTPSLPTAARIAEEVLSDRQVAALRSIVNSYIASVNDGC